MKTVSTKLDNSDFTRFQEICNESGLCASEYLRDMIKDDIRADKEFNEIEAKKTPETSPTNHLEPKITIVDV